MTTMKLLLKEDIDHLGSKGQVVTVKAGYGRNYLLPQKLAIAATPANVKLIEREQKRILKLSAEELAKAQVTSEQLGSITLTFTRKVGAHGMLYGSVTALDIAEALKAQSIDIDRRRIIMKDHIKEPGETEVPIKLHSEVKANIKVIVTAEE